MSDPVLLVPARFCGPPSSGNGGWTAGALAALVPECPDDRARAWPTVEVSLLRPPPLDVPMPVDVDDGVLTAHLEPTAADGADGPGGRPAAVAVARCTDTALEPVAPVTAATAAGATASYPGLAEHPFPTCFACGTAREDGDGLRIFPGLVEPAESGARRVAAPWTPHPSLSEDYHQYADEHPRASLASTWAALDCPGGWAGDFGSRLMVLARMRARIDTLPVIGEPHVVVGEARGDEGRKTFTATTLYDADGRVVGTAEHLWVRVDPAAFA
jgi:hypothetical protein